MTVSRGHVGVDPAQLTTLPKMLSPARFAPYLRACNGHTDQAARLYTWNIEVTAAFWGSMHALEVILRNALHAQLASRYARQDWWSDPSVRLSHIMVEQRDRAMADAGKTASRVPRPVLADDVVAALMFGFWVGLLGKGGNLQYETQFWQPTLSKAFPGYADTRVALHTDVDHLRLLRNRLAHHEPVFARHLAADHATLLRVADLISPEAHTYIDTHSRAPAVLASRNLAVTTGRNISF